MGQGYSPDCVVRISVPIFDKSCLASEYLKTFVGLLQYLNAELLSNLLHSFIEDPDPLFIRE